MKLAGAVIFLLCMLPSQALAVNYISWFGTRPTVDCFIIDNLSTLGHQVEIKYSDAEAKRLGKESTIAEEGKCYESGVKGIAVLDGKQDKVYFKPSETGIHFMGSYISYMNVGFNQDVLDQKYDPDDLRAKLQQTVDKDFGMCDIRKRIETHITIMSMNTPDGGYRWYSRRGAEIWLLKDDTRMVAPEFDQGYDPYSDPMNDEQLARVQNLVDTIGCSAVFRSYTPEKVQSILSTVKRYGAADVAPASKETPIASEIVESVGEKQIQWWLAVAAFVVLVGGIVVVKKLRK